MKMVTDARLGKFDLIITKDVSRFARDLEDSIHYIRKLKEYGVGIFFENQFLNTFDPNSELTLNTLFSIAQEESKKISRSVKFGHDKAIAKGHVLGSSNITGYKKENCKLVIVEEEAKFIRTLFELYATGEYGFYKLSSKLAKLGYTNRNGNFYDKGTLERILQNPKYKGFYRAREFETLDYRTKERKKNKKEDQIIYKASEETVPAIVSEELWDKANDIYKSRSSDYRNNNYWSGGLKYPLSSKMYCKEHNTNFQRSHGSRRKNRPTWSCGLYLQHRLEACASPVIAEKDLYNILGIIMDTIIPEKNIIISGMLELYKSIDKAGEYDMELKRIENKVNSIENEKRNALKFITNGTLTEEDLKVQFEDFRKELKNLANQKEEVLRQISILESNQDNIDKIHKAINEEIEGGSLENFIRKFVDEIIVSKIDGDRYNVKLDIFLYLMGTERTKIKGARHIDGATYDETLFLENESCSTIETKRAMDKENKFTYNVYIETL